MEAVQVGLVGVGMVGARFLERLVAAGHQVVAFDTDTEKLAAAVAGGAQRAACAREVAERCQTILLSLPGSHAVDAAMQGPEGILGVLRPGHLILDTGTSRPDTATDYAGRARDRGARFIDTPLTYRAPGPIFLVGGDESEFQRAEPLLQLLGYRVVHCGPVGAGQRMKLVNQYVLAARLAVYCEAAHLARSLDLDPEALVSALEFNEARGAIAPHISVPGGQLLALHTKDLEYLQETTAEKGIYAPLTDMVTRIFAETRSRAERDWAQEAITTHWSEGRKG